MKTTAIVQPPSFRVGEIHCPQSELELKYTLSGGQSFRWKETGEGWVGVLADRVWTLSRDNEDRIKYKVIGGSDSDNGSDSDASVLIDYFRLNTSLKELYAAWSSDANFAKVSKVFQGVRILRQDPVENIFAFICSSNNFISRISSMVEKLCTFYGEKICEVNGESYYGFPRIERLAGAGVEEQLRKAGFGYRAKFIHQSALTMLSFGGLDWLHKLEKLDYADAKAQLIKLHGVGAKVADCICLMSLGHLEAIPVDTHVYQIASQYYMPHLRAGPTKSVTTKVYNEIGQHFRWLYGPMAGWAHTILFCADLKKFNTTSSETPGKRKAPVNNRAKAKSRKCK